MAAWRSKSKEWDMGDYNATLEENEARLWCIRNNIYITIRKTTRWLVYRYSNKW